MTDEIERALHTLKLPGMASYWTSLEETHQYIDRHLEAAGGNGELFTPEAKSTVFEHAQGIPRRINRLALEAVKLSARNKVTTIDEELICVAIRGVDGI